MHRCWAFVRKHTAPVSNWKTLAITTIVFLHFCEDGLTSQQERAWRGGPAASRSVYRVICPDQKSMGTAFGHRSGKIITAEHVVRDCSLKTLQVVAPYGAITGVTEVASDPSLDLALLTPHIGDFVKTPLKIKSDDNLTLGGQVSTWGFPEGYKGPIPLLSVGYLAGIQEESPTSGTVVRQWAVNGAFNRGNSGGPLIETNTANVVGVISAKLAPIPKKLLSQIEDLEKNGSTEGKTIATALLYLRKQTQLVIGFAAMLNDLREFLQKHGIEP